MIYSGINGIGLALVVPCVQSLIADYTPAEKRGAAFGVLYFTGALGETPCGLNLCILAYGCERGLDRVRCLQRCKDDMRESVGTYGRADPLHPA